MKRIKFIKMIFENFKSFKGQHEFHFPDHEGFYVVSGINKVDPHLGANACGKTSIWDALFWVLYGVSIRGLKGADLLNKDLDSKKDSYNSRLYFMDETNTVYSIFRSWHPNNLFLFNETTSEKKETTNEEIINYFRLNKDQAVNSLIMGQGSPLFFDLSSSEKAALFENIIDLDHWNGCSERASSKYLDCMGEISKLEMMISNHEGSIHSLFSEDDIKRMEDDWQSKIAKSLEDNRSKIHDYRLKLNDISFQIEKISETVDLSIADRIHHLKEEETQILLEHSTINHQIKDLKDHFQELKNKKDFYITNRKCPTCSQDILKDFSQQMYEQLDNAVFDLELKEQDILKKLTNKKIEWEKNQEERKDLFKIKKDSEEVRDKVKNLEIQKQTFVITIQSLEDKEKEILKEKNPYIDMRQKTEEKRSFYTKAVLEAIDKIKKLTGIAEGFKFWKDHFKKIRLFMIQMIIGQLNVDINSAMSLLGLSDWGVKISTEKILKSGNIIPSISVFVSSPKIKEFVPWETWSGGEAQRLRIASAMGLSVLIQRLKGVSFNVEIWDEPTTWLSEEGTVDLLNLLKDRSSILKKQIWLIDHRTHEFGGFSGQYQIVKTEDTSEIVPLAIQGE